ncbi:MAG: EAL domain-containing protein, partial [Sulfurimonadaceae bacterium]|nr:EAL domain-containing protein [Sulfurimonadaceae bacterium]
ISIDDFGSGYSNFEYLLRLDADFIKIDGSLIKDIDTNIDSEDIVRTIVGFAKKKNIKVVAEFVSSEAIYNKIKELEIDFMQGYYLGMPNSTFDILKPI